MLAKSTSLSLMLALVAAAQTIPTPESVLGHKPGDDFYLANYDESRDYFHKLAAVSDRIKLISVGKTTRGLDWEIAIISSQQNLAQLDKYKDISRRLAQGRGLTDEQAQALAHDGKAIVHIDGGLHSTEVAGAQQSILLAYKLVSTQGDPAVDAILSNVILMLWPTLNPDGQNEVVAWYRKNVGTPYEVSPLPDLYQEYVGHDNNRDGYMNGNRVEPGYLLLPSPDRAVSHAHLHSALHRAYLVEHQSADGTLAQCAGHQHGGLSGRTPDARRGASRRLRQLVSRLSRLHTHLSKQHFLFHRDRSLSLRDAAFLYRRRIPERSPATHVRSVLQQPMEGRLVAPGRRRALHGRGIHGGAGYGREIS
jgi:hypothetical protein